jgi:hypothetical protein
MATTAPSDREPLVPVQRGSELDVADYLRQWLAHVRGRVRAVTYEGYEVLVRRHALPGVGHLKLRELRPLDLQNLYSDLLARSAEAQPLSAGTVLNLHLVLRQAFGQAVRWQLLDANPVAGAAAPAAQAAATSGRSAAPFSPARLGGGHLAGDTGCDRLRDRDAPGGDPESALGRPRPRADAGASAEDAAANPAGARVRAAEDGPLPADGSPARLPTALPGAPAGRAGSPASQRRRLAGAGAS